MWSVLLSILAFTVAANLDNLGVCLAYGANGTRITPPANLLIAAISGLATALSVTAGGKLAQWVGPATARLLGMAGMVLIGGWVCLKAIVDGWAPPDQKEPREVCSLRIKPLGLIVSILKEPLKADLDQSKTIDLKEALLLGTALSANCLASGVALGLLELPLVPTALAVAVGSFCCTHLGWMLGRFLGDRWPSRRTGLAAGLLLMAMAILGRK
ncbi:MAG TPA: sporulation membrane protein YtaF [Firmicutes bacterium]|jgi:putative sporulation protein YtaF|nr:sporulation membrane protein YtaF [Bacillota bacterium]HOQ23680.1 sporulation membrane protein YtaF [Bacillota bacterium]HPT67096.1 sporulation membrane protein YtaF [Bacillota bacterium]